MFSSRTALSALFGVFLIAGTAWAGPGLKTHVPEGWTVTLQKLGIDGSPDSMAEPHLWQTRQISSYDRDGGPNDDQHAELVYEGGTMLVDLKGPGVLTRIWTRDPQGTIYIYVDDMEYPLIIAPFEDLFTGSMEFHSPGFNLFASPLVSQGSGGYVSYVPIPYEKGCRIIVAGTDSDALSYQVTYLDLPKGTDIRSFELALSDDDVSFFRKWQKTWEDTNFRYHDRKTERYHQSRNNYFPGKDSLLFPIEGPGVITELEMTIGISDPDGLDKVWLMIYFDGEEEPGVVAPIGDFFGNTAKGSSDYDSVLLGKDKGRMWFRYPMPFKSYAELRIVNTSKQVADIQYGITWRPGPIGDQHYFFARYNRGVSIEGEAYRVADLKGEGHFAGCTLNASEAESLSFLDGDDVYLVDGRPGSEFHGTGTDDYFNAGWNFSTGPYFGPTSGVTLKSTATPVSVSAYRTLITEPVPFHSSFVFELEHGTGNSQPGIVYSSVVYWYQENPAPELWPVPGFDHTKLARK